MIGPARIFSIVVVVAALIAVRWFAMPEMLVSQPANGQFNYRSDQDAPTHLQVENQHSSGSNIYSEFRVKTAAGAGDFGITGPGFSDGSNMEAGEVFVVAESDAAGLLLKTNAATPIRGVVNGSLEAFRATMDGLGVTGHAPFTALSLLNALSGVRVDFAADDHNGYVGTQTDNPLQLMVGYNAKVTVYPDGSVEIWKMASEPTTNPTNGGFLYVAPNGALKYRGPNGTVTTLAQP